MTSTESPGPPVTPQLQQCFSNLSSEPQPVFDIENRLERVPDHLGEFGCDKIDVRFTKSESASRALFACLHRLPEKDEQLPSPKRDPLSRRSLSYRRLQKTSWTSPESPFASSNPDAAAKSVHLTNPSRHPTHYPPPPISCPQSPNHLPFRGITLRSSSALEIQVLANLPSQSASARAASQTLTMLPSASNSVHASSLSAHPPIPPSVSITRCLHRRTAILLLQSRRHRKR